MINGLGVLGWGVGGIEAEAAMLGQPMSMLIPQVLGFKLHGELPEGATATDLVLTVTELLRKKGVVGKFVEFYGPGVSRLPLADRATIGNMSPEFGSTCAIFPVDRETLRYLAFSGRPKELIELVEAYAKEQGLWHDENAEEPTFSDTVELDLGDVEPSLAGPKRPQDRVPLHGAKDAFRGALADLVGQDAGEEIAHGHDEAIAETFPASDPPANGAPGHEPDPHEPVAAPAMAAGTVIAEHSETAADVTLDGETFKLDHGHVVIAAITSCTNTSNPSVMIGAGLLARNAAARGLTRQPWVKTSLAPGSKVVTEYLDRAGLTEPLEELGFNLVGYGCTTCIGNSGPLPDEISAAIAERRPRRSRPCSAATATSRAASTPTCETNYLASPPLVVAYALAGTMDIDLDDEPLGHGRDGKPVYLHDIWPTPSEIAAGRRCDGRAVASMFAHEYADVFDGDERWHALDVPTGDRFAWDERLDLRPQAAVPRGPDARARAARGHRGRARAGAARRQRHDRSHLAGRHRSRRTARRGIPRWSTACSQRDFNSYGARRGNHEVMMRGTFANIRLRNQLAPGTEGGVTTYLPDGEEMSIYDAAMKYQKSGVPLVVLAGKEYGSGSSRDWAAKGTLLLGVRAVIAESFERIHRSNLVGMGVLPLQFPEGESAASLGLTGDEEFSITGLAEPLNAGELPRSVSVRAGDTEFEARLRIDTPKEAEYFRHGGILQYVLRSLMGSDA